MKLYLSNDDFPFPEQFDIVRETQLIKVHTRGTINSDPIDISNVYIPEGKNIDVPRSFASSIRNITDIRYRETVFIDVEEKQRPLRIKYMIDCLSNKRRWLIQIIRSLGNIRRKIFEVDYQLNHIKRLGIEITGVILLVASDIPTEKLTHIIEAIETPVFISIYERGD